MSEYILLNSEYGVCDSKVIHESMDTLNNCISVQVYDTWCSCGYIGTDAKLGYILSLNFVMRFELLLWL
jgi:hypothetical protein